MLGYAWDNLRMERRCGSLETLEDGEGPGNDCAGGGGGWGGGGPQSFCCRVGFRDGDPWDGVEARGLDCGRGGRVQSFLFMFRKIEK